MDLARPDDVLSRGFQFQEHMADIAIHSWGDLLTDAMEQGALGMMEYMCPELGSQVRPVEEVVVEVRGRNLFSLYFMFLQEVLYRFHAEQFIFSGCRIAVMETGGVNVTTALNNYLSTRKVVDGQHVPLVASEAPVTEGSEEENFLIRAVLRGEKWREGEHKQGTEIKAVTMHSMNIELREEDDLWHTYVVVDI